ncbi:MAG: endonuclease III [Fusobacteria bacterium]|nr:MAG: endonuclease III [Fusobacteriota bacterium]KAF0228087.1 MAG: endonuclease [Fusobacteriota bacterium]
MRATKKRKEIIELLKKEYWDAKAELDFTTPFELLVATILSAQATDVQVNKVTKELFKIAGTPETMALMSVNDMENSIKSIGLYKNKAKNLLAMSKILIEDYNSLVPDSIEELIKLPGVGRKTANVVVSNAFGVPAIAVDTHVFRVSNRLGLADANNVFETEKQLMQVIERPDWTMMHHCLIFHGRRICKARNPLCDICAFKEYCKYLKILSKKI